MLFRLAVCVALLAVCHAGLNCTRCNQARGEDEMICNTQPHDTKPNHVECEDNEVCTIDVRCDGRDRPYWIKGCERISGITIGMDNPVCQDNLRRCRVHCDSGDHCNEFAPENFLAGLACTANVTETTLDSGLGTPEPTAEPVPIVDEAIPTTECVQCENTEGEDAECNDQGLTETCGENQVCWGRYKCRKQGEPGRGLIKKQCKNIQQCESTTGPFVEEKNVDGITQFVGFLCCSGDNCNEQIVDDLEPLLTPFCDVPVAPK